VANFVPFALTYKLRLIRKAEIMDLLKKNRIISYPPDYLYVDYALMIAIFCRHPKDDEIFFPLSDATMSTFAGSIKYW
jgi:hypothetical protein